MNSRKVWIIREQTGVETTKSFQELAELVAAGVIGDDSVVRRVDSQEVLTVDSIIGLERAVARIRLASIVDSDSNDDELSKSLAEKAQSQTTRDDTRSASGHLLTQRFSPGGLLVLLSSAVACIAMIAIQVESWRRFPTVADQSWLGAQLWLPLIGKLNSFEFVIILFDTLLAGILVSAFMGRRACRK